MSAATAPGRTASSAEEDRNGFDKLIGQPEAGPVALLIGAIITFTLLNGTFASTLNIGNLLAFTPELGMVALAMTLLMTSGEFDLSVGSVFGFAPVLMWFFFNEGVFSLEVAFIITLGVAALIGLTSGLFVTKLRHPVVPRHPGHAARRAWRGTVDHAGLPAADVGGGRRDPGRDPRFRDFFVPTPFGEIRVYMSLCLVHPVDGRPGLRADGVQVRQLDPGRRWESPRRDGSRRSRGAYQGLALHPHRRGGRLLRRHQFHPCQAANPNSGDGYELEVIAMTVIGGTVSSGGKGTIIGTVIGVLPLARHAQRHRHGRRPGAGLQDLHRRHHPGHDGPALVHATTTAGDVKP